MATVNCLVSGTGSHETGSARRLCCQTGGSCASKERKESEAEMAQLSWCLTATRRQGNGGFERCPVCSQREKRADVPWHV
jgi:hypothetical protein